MLSSRVFSRPLVHVTAGTIMWIKTWNEFFEAAEKLYLENPAKVSHHWPFGFLLLLLTAIYADQVLHKIQTLRWQVGAQSNQ